MNALQALIARLRILRMRHKSRRDLARLLHDMNAQELDALVSDVGISRSDLIEEVSRPIWAASATSNDAASAKPGTRSKSPMPAIRALRAWQ